MCAHQACIKEWRHNFTHRRQKRASHGAQCLFAFHQNKAIIYLSKQYKRHACLKKAIKSTLSTTLAKKQYIRRQLPRCYIAKQLSSRITLCFCKFVFVGGCFVFGDCPSFYTSKCHPYLLLTLYEESFWTKSVGGRESQSMTSVMNIYI